MSEAAEPSQQTLVMSNQNRINPDQLKYQLQNDDLFENIEHDLRNERWKLFGQQAQWYRPPGVEPLINEEGIYTLLGIAHSHIDKNIHLSTFTEKQIFMIMQWLESDIVDCMRMNWGRFDVRKENADIIVDIITNPIFSAWMRAMGGLTIDLHKNVQKVEQHSMMETKRGGISSLLNFGRKQ